MTVHGSIYLMRLRKVISVKNIALTLLIALVITLTLYSVNKEPKYKKSVPIINALLLDEISKFGDKIVTGDIQYFTDIRDCPFAPFLGNGYIGVLYNGGESSLYYSVDIHTNMNSVAINPLFRPKETPEIFFMDFEEGSMKLFYSYPKIKGVVLRQTIAVHRGHKSAILQKFQIENDSDKTVTIELELPFIEGSTTNSMDIQDFVAFPIENPKNCLFIRSKAEQIIAPPQKTTIVYFISFFVCSQDDRPFSQPEAHSIVNQVITLSTRSPLQSFYNQHVSIWKNAMSINLVLSNSKAPKSVNTNLIKTTAYFILSLSKINSDGWMDSPSFQDMTGCYSGNPTLFVSALWSHDLSKIDQIFSVTHIWLITLANGGCFRALQSTHGIITAFFLSLGSLKFTHQHLEMNISPLDLHREMTFLNVLYDKNLINIKISLKFDNKPSLSISHSRGDDSIYACGGACLSPAIKTDSFWKSLSVKLTVPETSILYLSCDLNHINLLKHGIHVSSVRDAPSYGTGIITMHRHGSVFADLPNVFWVIVFAVVVVPHMALAICLYRECFRK